MSEHFTAIATRRRFRTTSSRRNQSAAHNSDAQAGWDGESVAAIISFTLAIAFAVKLIGGVLGVTSGTVVGTVVVAIGIHRLKLLPHYYNKEAGLRSSQKSRVKCRGFAPGA